ncbi:MAG: hypothetical protein N3C63_10645 [Rhodocyclaceae bacterium]|nr:hypothetical protein [Rhodocyclaceae bacterium]
MEARSIEVLCRDTGYLRLRLPAPCRSAAVGARLESGLKALPGVQRVTWLTPEGKLAIRFDARAVSHADIARRIKELLADLPAAEAPVAAAAAEPAPGLAERLGDLRARLIAAAPARFRPLVENATTEKALTNFTNDVVAFYLIKVHWELITRYWIKDPVKYANAWLTVFYLVFLLVRYRKS